MTFRARKILFYSLSFLFIVIGTIAIFYSNGWRFDLETMKIDKLGALFFKITPSDAMITIDGANFEFSPDFLRSGTLIANLFPKKYAAIVTKTGYQTWIKELEVQPSLVTLASPVILLPEKINLNLPINKGVSNFWLGPKYLAVSDGYNSLKINSKPIIGNEISGWSSDGEDAITISENNYYATSIADLSESANLSLMFKKLRNKKMADESAIADVKFSPINKNQFLITTQKGIYLMDSEKLVLTALYSGLVDYSELSNNEIIFAANGEIFAYNLISGIKSSVINQKFGRAKSIKISPSSYYVSVIEENGHLSIIDRKSLKIALADNGVVSASFSPNSMKIAYYGSNNELSIHPLEQSAIYTSESPARFSLGSINDEIIWHKESGHIFFKYSSGLYLLEANSLPPINMQVIDLNAEEYDYNADTNTVYVLKNKNLYGVEL